MAANADGSVIINTKVDTRGATQGLNTIESKVGSLGSAFKKLGGIIAAVFAVRKIVAFSKECIELGSDLEEVQNVVDVTFGKMSGAIDNFAKDAATQFGLSELSAKQYTSTLGAMYKSMGFTEEAAAGMSVEMTKLAADMASFYNLDSDTAFQKIRAGISGETEPLKQLGINLSEANLEEYRLAQGIATSYKNMDQQNKAILRYNYLLHVTSDAQGDFARTSGSWANQVKVLRLQLQSIKANLGQGFINLFTPVLQVINKLLQGLAKVAAAFKALTELITGKKASAGGGGGMALDTSDLTMAADNYTDAADAAGDYADATSDAAKATSKAKKANDKYLSGLDEIRHYQQDIAEDSGSGSGGGGGGKGSKGSAGTGSGGGLPMPSVDFGSLAQGDTVVDALTEKMEKLWNAIKTGVQPAIDALKRLWNEGLSELKDFSWKALLDFYNLFLVPVGNWVLGEGLPRLIDGLNNGLMAINWDKINAGLAGMWSALAPFAIKIGEGLLWFYENALIPLGTWTMNEAVPRFLETLTTVISILNTVLDAIKPVFEWFWDNILLPLAQWTGGAFLDIWDGINAALRDFGNWCKEHQEIVSKVIAVVTAGAGIIAIAMNGVIAIIAGVIAAGVLLWTHWDTIREKAVAIWGVIKEYLATTWENLKFNAEMVFAAVKEKVINAWNAIKATGQMIWTSIKITVTNIWNTLKSRAISVFTTIKEKIGAAWDAIKTTAKSIWEGIKTTVIGIWETLKSRAISVFTTIKEKIAAAWNAIKTTAKSIWETIKSTVTNLWDTIKSRAISVFTTIKEKIASAWEAIKTTAKSIWETIKTTVFGVWDTVKSRATSIFTTIKDTISDVWDSIKETATTIWDTITTTLTDAWDTISAAVDSVISPIADTFDSVWSTIQDTLGGVISWINDTFSVDWSSAWTAIRDTLAGIWDGLTDMMSVPLNAVISVLNSIIDVINGVIGKINSISFRIDIPSWVPYYGGSWWGFDGFNLGYLGYIPALAKGAVIPPNAPFVAALGDQKHGTNIEAPLETIKEAVRDVVGGSGDIHVTINLDGRVVFDDVLKQARRQQQYSGANPFSLA